MRGIGTKLNTTFGNVSNALNLLFSKSSGGGVKRRRRFFFVG
jgi:hypothetical protein